MRKLVLCGLFNRIGLAALASAILFIGAAPAAAQQPISTPVGPGARPACEITALRTTTAFPCGAIVFSRSTTMSPQMVAGIARANGATVRFEYRSVRAAAVTVPDRLTLRALTLSSLTVIPDRIVTIIARPPGKGKDKNNDNSNSEGQIVPYNVTHIGAGPGQLQQTGSGVGVAIVDTGIDFNHTDLAVAPEFFDAFGGTGRDMHGHGTHVGGILAALNNDTGVVGVAPDATLYSVRVLDSSGAGSDATIMFGLDWIWQQNELSYPATRIRVANMSFGRPGSVDDNWIMHLMIQIIAQQGVTFVAAAGNDPYSVVSQKIPAAYPEVLAVAGATAKRGSNACNRLPNPIEADAAAFFTTDGPAVVVSAPADEQENVDRRCFIEPTGILSLKLGGGTIRFSGTSMAAPHVAGVAALIAQSGTTDPTVIGEKIRCGARGIGTLPLDTPASSYSFDGEREGILSAWDALTSTGVCPP